jgi:serine phosphatase RsbU (regulator of sigma subunit)
MSITKADDTSPRAEHEGLVGDVLVALAGEGDLHAVLAACAQAILGRLNAALTRVWTLNEDARVLELQASAGLAVDVDEPYTVPVGRFKVSRVVQSRQLVVSDNLLDDPQFNDLEWAKREEIVSFAGFPLVSGDRFIGVTTVFGRQPLPAEGVEALQQVTGAIATHIERTRRQQQLRAEHAVLVRLQELTAALLSLQLDLGQVVQKVTDAATELSNAEFGAFFHTVPDPEGADSYDLYTVSGASREAVERLDLPGRTALFESISLGVALVRSDDVTIDTGDSGDAPDPGLSPSRLRVLSCLAIPIVGRSGDVLGGLVLGHSEPGRFDEQTEFTVATIAGHAAIAVENARLYHQERTAATTLQRGLLPRGLPTVPGGTLAARYQPASAAHRVGGDWYDAVALPDGRLALTIGDVCGHDIRAAATMGQLCAAIRAYTLDSPEPAGVVARIEQFCAATDIGMFTTLIQALYDPTDHTLEFVRAGHPPPLLIDGDGSSCLVDMRAVPPLACRAIDHQKLAAATTRISLPPGSTLLLYTDGLVERRTWTIEDGLANLMAAVRDAPRHDPDVLCEHLIDELADQPLDDTAVLALRVDG